MATEYIEREAAKRELLSWAVSINHPEYLIKDDALHIIDSFPAADVAPVRHGRWLHTKEPLGWKDVDCMECSACHDSWIIEEDYCFDDMPLWNYCPSCGAKMDRGDD